MISWRMNEERIRAHFATCLTFAGHDQRNVSDGKHKMRSPTIIKVLKLKGIT